MIKISFPIPSPSSKEQDAQPYYRFLFHPRSFRSLRLEQKMAAVLCNAVGDLFNIAGKVLCLPCRAVNVSCNSAKKVICTPFFPYIALTFGLNIPSIIYGVRAVFSWCSAVSSWLLMMGLLSLCHILGSSYIVYKIREPLTTPVSTTAINAALSGDKEQSTTTKPDTSQGKIEAGTYYTADQQQQQDNIGPANSYRRIRHVICYDKVVAVYIVIHILWVVLLSHGFQRQIELKSSYCDRAYHDFTQTSLSLGFTYFSLVGFAFLLSLCCAAR